MSQKGCQIRRKDGLNEQSKNPRRLCVQITESLPRAGAVLWGWETHLSLWLGSKAKEAGLKVGLVAGT